MGASVRAKPSMVARFGPIIAAPLANPATAWPRLVRRVATLMTVSVVRMACAASLRASEPGRKFETPRGMPASRVAIGSGRPITPVLATSTDSAGQPRPLATSAAMRSASRSPWAPVQALALPLHTTMARADGLGTRLMLSCTGAARTWFCVNTPAPLAGRVLAITARSRRSGSLLRPMTVPL